MSSMLSAPAHIPAIRVASFGAGLADPDLIRGSAIRTFSPSRCDKPGLFGQRHHRHQPGARHEIVVIEHRRIRARTYATLAPEVPF